MIHLRYDDAVEQLRKAVEVRGPDFVYPNEWRDAETGLCQYVVTSGEPACIVGQVFSQVAETPSSVPNGDVLRAAGRFGVELDDGALALLMRCQSWQDNRTPWGESVAKAIEGLWYDNNLSFPSF